MNLDNQKQAHKPMNSENLSQASRSINSFWRLTGIPEDPEDVM
ncbi:MAG: hypothetical protein PVG70_20810 [Desulfobacterales bacterium]|jgi:hypothetical protein